MEKGNVIIKIITTIVTVSQVEVNKVTVCLLSSKVYETIVHNLSVVILTLLQGFIDRIVWNPGYAIKPCQID